MAIARDSSSSGGGTNSGTSVTYSHTTVAPTLLLVFVLATGTDQITGVTYNSVAMTQLKKAATVNSAWNYIYGLANPATGANNVVVSAGSAVFIRCMSAAYSGTATTGIPDATGNNDTINGTSASVSVTTVKDNCWLFGGSLGNAVPSAGANTTIITANSLTNTDVIFERGPVTPAGAYSMTLTMSASDTGMIAVSFAPPTVSNLHLLSLLGVGK